MTHIPKIIEYLNKRIEYAMHTNFDLQHKDHWSEYDKQLERECFQVLQTLPDWVKELEASLVKVDASGMSDVFVGGYVEGKNE